MIVKKIKIIFIALLVAILLHPQISQADSLSQKLSGKILLQVESSGEAWYINPGDQKRYYMGRPDDAFDLMRSLGIGITTSNLEKIPVGIITSGEQDDDGDGLSNALEGALGTDPQNTDTDNDGYSDKTEVENNYNPLGAGKINIDPNFSSNNSGKIFLQIEKNGEAWYIKPDDNKRYFLSRPQAAFTMMQKMSLGISNEDLNKITQGSLTQPAAPSAPQQSQITEKEAIYAAADAFMANNAAELVSYFVPEMKKGIEHTMQNSSAETKFAIGNLLAGAKLESSTENEKVYLTEAYFSLGGYKVPMRFYVQKQEDSIWLLTNL